MGLIGDIFKGISSKNAANAASGAEQGGAKAAQALELQNQQAAQGSQADATARNQGLEQNYNTLGANSANSLNGLLQTGFQAPTFEQAQNNPGYQFALSQGTEALDKGAAARGDVFSGTQGKALQQYGQNLGAQNYQQVYNNALNNYNTNYQSLLGGAQLGQQAIGEQGQLGQAGAQNLANVDLTGANQQALQINNAANARASGYLNKASALNGMVDNMGNTFQKALFAASSGGGD